jgi:L-lactate dehydrogenase (cytochrome)
VKPAEVRNLLRLKTFEFDRETRLLAKSHSIEDLRRHARRSIPKVVFDYIEGGADSEVTLTANVAAFESRRLFPIALSAIDRPDARVSVLGKEIPLPLGLAPTGYSRLTHSEGESAVARAAATAGIPYVMSTVASTSVADLGRVPDLDLWAQLYVLKDRDQTWAFLERIAAAGVTTLEISVDVPVAGFRSRDIRNGLTIPPALSPRAIVDIGAHPGYWVQYLRAPAMTFPNMPQDSEGGRIGSISDFFESKLGWDDVADIRRRWSGNLLLKGPVGADDARRALDMGLQGVHLSNHGGRQLDRCATSLDLLTEVRTALGPVPLIVIDSGIRHGSDIVTAYALGADLAMVGRAYLYGLAVAGERGVAHVIGILVEQVQRTMHLLGVPTMAEIRERGTSLVRDSRGSE